MEVSMMTNDSSRAVRWLVIIALSVATAGMFLISMRANYLYGRSIGQSPETQEAFAWANVGADIWKGFGLIVVFVLWRVRLRRTAITTGLTWLVCLCFSVSSAIGIYVQERTSLTGGRAAKHASYEDARKELADIERKLNGLAQHRSAAEVEAAIAAVFARTVFVGERIRGTVGTLSANCTKDDKRTAEACAEVAGLREELALASESTKLEGRATALRQQVSDLRLKGGSVAPDPVGEFWEWITRGFVTVRAVGFGLPLFFALMIETVSAFGPLAIVAYAEATRRQSSDDMTRSVAPGRAGPRVVEPDGSNVTLIESELGGIVSFMAERTEPTADPAAVSNEELHAHYELWCTTKSLRPLSREAFGAEFDRVRELPQLEGKIRKFGTRYYGIRLIERTVTKLLARKRSDK
jgi:hypothetical protein